MTAVKNLGIWMDNSCIHLIEFSDNSMSTSTITSEFLYSEKEYNWHKNDHALPAKMCPKLSEFYKKLDEMIDNYEDVILFGPNDAKIELLNLFIDNNRLVNLKVSIKYTDKMTENQQAAFVKDYFFAF